MRVDIDSAVRPDECVSAYRERDDTLNNLRDEEKESRLKWDLGVPRATTKGAHEVLIRGCSASTGGTDESVQGTRAVDQAVAP